jgi:3'(2'), 5'-bisphosphate nucleotidase
MHDLEQELELAKALARLGGEILLEVRSTDFKVDYKIADDPVTEGDRRANSEIVAGIAKAFPSDGIIAEESENIMEARKLKRCWFVDPLDGTREFVAKRDDFAVMIGLSIEGRATLGVVYQPMVDKLYSGVINHGAELEHEGAKRALQVSEVADPAKLRLISSRSHRSNSVDAVKSRLQITAEEVSGSVGIKIGLIAENIADLYVHISDKSAVWDTCGPEAILRAAGGMFSDVGGRAFDYRGVEIYNRRGILACNAKAYGKVLSVVAEVAKEKGFIEN